ncbi:MAG: 50S ribosomal protein L25 [Candidatus Doudnabacteria bacterium]|nr:50S ribosomal protein L25 [Candidatus Doudnabacteria bacterium]
MEQITLTATKRELTGKHANKLRKEEKLPGVLYGHELQSQSIEVGEKDFIKTFKQAGESTLVSLTLNGESRPVLIHDVQRHFLTNKPIHVDFYAVNMKEKLRAHVAVHFVGESPAVKSLGGVLVKNISEVEVECLPADLPPYFEIDVSNLNTFEDEIRVSDIAVSDKVKILAHPEEMIVNVAAPRSEAELAELEQAPVAVDVSTVEGVAEKPKEGEEGEEGEPMEVPKEQPAAEKKE